MSICQYTVWLYNPWALLYRSVISRMLEFCEFRQPTEHSISYMTEGAVLNLGFSRLMLSITTGMQFCGNKPAGSLYSILL